MTRVTGDLKIITGLADQVTEVWVRSKVARPVAGGWLMTANDRKPVFDGKLDVELLPGACVLVAVCSGTPGDSVELIVPESGTASLEACVRAAEAAGDVERDALDELRRDFSAWIDEARGAVSTAGESAKAAKTSADAAKVSEANTGKSATAAKSSEVSAKESASAAASSRSDASSFADAAKVSETNAGKSASAAKTSETGAKDSASAASNSASAAKSDADKASASAATAQAKAGEASTSATTASDAASRASASESAAKASAASAASSASAAKTSETNAGKSATTASTHATNAGKSATAAKSDADRAATIASSTSWDGDRLTVNGKTSPPLKGDKGDPGGVRGVAVEGSGTDPVATGNQALALGWSANAKGGYATAVGHSAQAGRDASIAVGYSAQAGGKNSIAMGLGAVVAADHEESTAIGAYSTTTEPKQLRIGNDWEGHHMSLAGDVRLTQEPSRDDNAATKKYVDSAVQNNTTPPTWDKVEGKPNEFSPSAHKHTLADITNAPNSHTSAATGDTLVSRDSGGRAQFATPTGAGHAATKGYVDGAVRDKADKSYVDTALQSVAKGAFELRVASSAPASGTASNVITFVKE